MASDRDLNHKISSLKNMQKVMKAMNMIASIKLRKLVPYQEALKLFESAVDGIIRDIERAQEDSSHPLLKGYRKVTKTHVVIFTADKGLCGSHNSSAQKALDVFAKEQGPIVFDVTAIGTKGAHYCRRKGYDLYHQTEINDRFFSDKVLKEISDKLFIRFINGEIQELHVISNDYLSAIHQETQTSLILPISGIRSGEGKSAVLNAKTEPEDFIIKALELYLFYTLRIALTNSYLSEQASRMTAMENATNNSEDLIDRYVTLQNRARQTSITNEIIEIVSGKEALKG